MKKNSECQHRGMANGRRQRWHDSAPAVQRGSVNARVAKFALRDVPGPTNYAKGDKGAKRSAPIYHRSMRNPTRNVRGRPNDAMPLVGAVRLTWYCVLPMFSTLTMPMKPGCNSR